MSLIVSVQWFLCYDVSLHKNFLFAPRFSAIYHPIILHLLFFFLQDYTLDVVHFGVTLLWVVANSVWGFVSLFVHILHALLLFCSFLTTLSSGIYLMSSFSIF